MKLKEKLAREQRSQIIESIGTYELHESDLDIAFIAGFEKAKDMSKNIWENSYHIYCDFYWGGLEKLKDLGDEEVE